MITKYDLSGEWLFSFDQSVYDDTIILPSTTAMAHKGIENTSRETGYLTELYPFKGTAYYKREINLTNITPGKTYTLYIERTRISNLSINGQKVGTNNSLIAPHIYDITSYVAPKMIIELAIANEGYPTGGGHMTSPDTQTNWNGILGKIEIREYNACKLEKAFIKPCFNNRNIEVFFDYMNAGEEFDASLELQYRITRIKDYMTASGKNYTAIDGDIALLSEPAVTFKASIHLLSGSHTGSFTIKPDWDSLLWSEYNPYYMELTLTITNLSEPESISFVGGIRDFGTTKHDFIINGIPTKLRGKHDGLLFPLTGAAPMDVKDYLKVMGTAVRYGINHYRYHTCCPPDAAFMAADLLGIYMEPELPFWGTVAAVGEEGYNEAEQNYLINEGMLILDNFSAHPSMCMMSMGNELWGSRERINDIMGIFKEHNNFILYTQSSNGFQFVPKELPNEDFFVGARLAGPVDGHNDRLIRASFATCDAPLGVLQTDAPSTAYNFDKAILGAADSDANSSGDIAIQYGTGVKIVKADDSMSGVTPKLPIMSHEICQYFFYPDYKLLSRYKGILKPRNIEAFRTALSAAGLSSFEEQYAANSGHFSVACYKEELEMMHRSRYMAGYQILDIQDFTGQGTALVGVLDAFMKSKGLIDESDWRSFCSDDVLMASFDSYVLAQDKAFNAKIMLSHFNPLLNLSDACVSYSFCEGETLVAQGKLPISVNSVGTYTLGEIICNWAALDPNQYSHKITLKLHLEGTDIHNQYTFWVYKNFSDEDIDTALSQGKIIWANPESTIPGFYCTDFWNYTMFKQISESMNRPVAVGTLGASIDTANPIFKDFACEAFQTPQWYSLISSSNLAILDSELKEGKYEPIVQMIDNPWRNHTLGLIYKLNDQLATVIPKNILTSTLEGRALLMSIIKNS